MSFLFFSSFFYAIAVQQTFTTQREQPGEEPHIYVTTPLLAKGSSVEDRHNTTA
jgi:hypothetical protein